MLDHPVILIIVIAAALLRWLWQKSQTENQDSERPTVPGQSIPRASETQTEEERIRRFLEALGQPATSTPPRKVTPKRQVIDTFKRLSEPTLPPLVTVPPPLPPPIWAQPILIEEAAPRPVETRVFQPAVAKELSFEVHDLGTESLEDRSPAAMEQPGFRLKLRSPQGLRDAIVLREIFGPPRSLQAIDPISGF